ncbi:MAG: FAD-dependent oxidoreductase [Oscillatoriales cyanobacterium SM2_2_1]|nr:FAD-dependent oxidoreductase [Oscillatoriales cyanobacterium SM2_2_1]
MAVVHVVGCGIIGAAVAEFLSHTDFEIHVYEQNSAPALGATAAALGVIMPVSSGKLVGDVVTLRLESLRYYDALPMANETAGVLTLCDRPSDTKMEQRRQQRAAQGFVLEYWDEERLRDICPQIVANFGVYSPADRAVDGVKLAHHWVGEATTRGVQFHWQTEIALEAVQGWAQSDQVVLTNGLGLNHFLPVPRVQPVGGQAVRLHCPDLAIAMVVHWLTNDPIMPDLNLVPRGNGVFDLGATVEFPPYVLPQLLHPKRLLASAQRICPQLHDARILSTWTGDRPRPLQARSPMIGFLQPNVLVATGHYRNGILMAPITAAIIRDLIIAGHSSYPWQFLCPDFLSPQTQKFKRT